MAFVPPLSRPLSAALTPRASRTTTALLSSAVAVPQLASARSAAVRAAPTLAPAPEPQPHAGDYARGPGGGAASGVGIVLFRSDLRVHDHAALSRALEECATIVPVFCFDPRHFGRTEHGFDKTGKYRARFLLDAVADLRDRFQRLGSDLLVRVGKPETVVPELARMTGARTVYVHREVTFEEQQVEAALQKALNNGQKTELALLWSNTLYHELDLPFALTDMPDVYSDFREAVEHHSKIREPLPAPESINMVPPGLDAGKIPSLTDLGIADLPTPGSPPHPGVSPVRGGEREALARVRAYVRDSRRVSSSTTSLADSASTPNSSGSNVCAHLGADFSCRISPWLALGCVSPRRIFHEMAQAPLSKDVLMRSSTYFELVWRDFFRCITAKYSCKRSAAVARGAGASGKKAGSTASATAAAAAPRRVAAGVM